MGGRAFRGAKLGIASEFDHIGDDHRVCGIDGRAAGEGHFPGREVHNAIHLKIALIVSLSPETQHKAVELTRTMACGVEFWPILDPTSVEGSREVRLDAYRQVRDELRRRIEARFALDLKPVP